MITRGNFSICPTLQAAMGCVNFQKPGELCAIYIADDAVLESDGAKLEHVMRHELGHCNGWPPDHPGYVLPEQDDAPWWPQLPPSK